jgi:hypothetical protein
MMASAPHMHCTWCRQPPQCFWRLVELYPQGDYERLCPDYAHENNQQVNAEFCLLQTKALIQDAHDLLSMQEVRLG